MLLASLHLLKNWEHSTRTFGGGRFLLTVLRSVQIILIGIGSVRGEESRLYQNCSIVRVMRAITDTRSDAWIAQLT